MTRPINPNDVTGDDTLYALAAAGVPVDSMSEEEREVFRRLTRAELDLLLDIKSRLDAAGPEVQAHALATGAALF